MDGTFVYLFSIKTDIIYEHRVVPGTAHVWNVVLVTLMVTLMDALRIAGRPVHEVGWMDA